MSQMQIGGSEDGVVRLFHLDLPREAIERFTAQAGTGEWPLKYALGAKTLREAFVDVVDIRDLGDMRLSDYIAQAYGVQGAELKGMRAQIDGLKGHVVVLPSQAFARTAQTLTIATPLRWIGSFGEVSAKPTGPKLKSDSARRVLSEVDDDMPASRNGPSAKMVLIAAAVLLLILLVVFVL